MVADTLILVVVCFFYGFAHHLFPMKTAFLVCCVNYVLDSVISLASMASNVYVQDLADSPDEVKATISTGLSINHVITIFIALFGIFVSYNMFGHDYGAAVMTAGNIGWGCGSAPNAVANEKSVMDEYGWHTVAWVLYPSFAVIIDDIYNPIFLSVVSGFFAA